jgi:DNA-binding NarL/FixJ family response regulator
VLVARVSWHTQRGHLDAQIAWAKAELERHGYAIVDVFREIGTGKRIRRINTALAFHRARELNAIVVFKDLSRMLRHPDWRRKGADSKLSATDAMMQKFLRCHRGDVLLIIPPDAPEAEIRRARVEQGRIRTGNRGGRPRKPTKETQLALAQKLRAQGQSYEAIARRLNRSSRTVWQWLHTIG